MPIIFESRLGNSKSDKKLKKIYSLHNALWTIYYTIFMAGFGFGIAALVGVNVNPFLGLLVVAFTIGMLVVFFRYQRRRR